jgi:hypothetical protein
MSRDSFAHLRDSRSRGTLWAASCRPCRPTNSAGSCRPPSSAAPFYLSRRQGPIGLKTTFERAPCTGGPFSSVWTLEPFSRFSAGMTDFLRVTPVSSSRVTGDLRPFSCYGVLCNQVHSDAVVQLCPSLYTEKLIIGTNSSATIAHAPFPEWMVGCAQECLDRRRPRNDSLRSAIRARNF